MNILNEKKSFSLTFGDGGPIRKGDDGKSAYEVALEQGFEGDEQTWLDSLKGEKGEKGDKGDKGEDGKDGEGAFALSECAVPITVSVESHGEEEDQVLRTSYGSERPLTSFTIRGGCTLNGVLQHPDYHSQLIRRGEEGSIAVKIEGSSESKTITLPLSSGLAATGEEGIYDEIRLNADGSGTLIRRCGFKKYDGTEEVVHRPNYNESRFELSGVDDVYPKGKESVSLCSHYTYTSDDILDYQQRIHSYKATWATQHPGFTDAESYKAYLAAEYAAGTPVTLCYRLKEPREETLTKEQIAALGQIILYKGYNRITNSAYADMSMTYTADTESYVEVKLEELRDWVQMKLNMLGT